MEAVYENLRTESRKKEILSEVAELLEEAGILTNEEKNRIKNLIWQDEILKRI